MVPYAHVVAKDNLSFLTNMLFSAKTPRSWRQQPSMNTSTSPLHCWFLCFLYHSFIDFDVLSTSGASPRSSAIWRFAKCQPTAHRYTRDHCLHVSALIFDAGMHTIDGRSANSPLHPPFSTHSSDCLHLTSLLSSRETRQLKQHT